MESPTWEEINAHDTLRTAPWYHVVMEDDNGKPIHTYLAEAQLMQEEANPNVHPSLNELAEVIQRKVPQLRH